MRRSDAVVAFAFLSGGFAAVGAGAGLLAAGHRAWGLGSIAAGLLVLLGRWRAARVEGGRFPVEETTMVAPNQPSQPYPPPGEADPPQPARIPEPYPPPDEGTPPTPAPDPGAPDGDD